MKNSLRLRLIGVISFSLLVLASAVAIILERAFEQSLARQLQANMQTQIFMMLTASDEEEPGVLFIPEVVREDRFNQIDSGSYAFVLDQQSNEVWRSFSAVDVDYSATDFSEPGQFRFDQQTLAGVDFFRLSYAVIWESEDDSEHFYQYYILQDVQNQNDVIAEFRVTLWGWFAFVLLAMLVILLVVLRWALKPLKQIAADLSSIESGKQQTLSKNYPVELTPLTRNLNVLIEAERAQREKYRNTLSNLAHSLKTPLAILKGIPQQSENDEQNELLQQQVSRMDEIIQYQLLRVSTGAQGHMLASVNVKIALEKITSALAKVYRDKYIDFSLDIDEQCRFYGDEGDFMELMGNLLDNACKWTMNVVEVKVTSTLEPTQQTLAIVVSDNGPGVPVSKRKSILKRGQRLDEQTEGQGIGLSVVAELVHQYHGSISIESSDHQGAAFHLLFQFQRA